MFGYLWKVLRFAYLLRHLKLHPRSQLMKQQASGRAAGMANLKQDAEELKMDDVKLA